MRLSPAFWLLLNAPLVFAQPQSVSQESMRQAWQEDQQQFDSVASPYNDPFTRRYGYPRLDQTHPAEPAPESTTDETPSERPANLGARVKNPGNKPRWQ